MRFSGLKSVVVLGALVVLGGIYQKCSLAFSSFELIVISSFLSPIIEISCFYLFSIIIFFSAMPYKRKLELRPTTYLKIVINTWMNFKHPFSILCHYLKFTSPQVVFLRNNFKFKIISPYDLVSAISIFSKKEYGSILKDSIVVDIGASIGLFSLYAAMNGAKKVYAFEPCIESFNALKNNIRINSLSNVVIPHRCAVTNHNSCTYFPENHCHTNKISTYGTKTKATTLSSILKNIDCVNILKIDCEGAEHSIFPADVTKVENIRMEYHGSIPPYGGKFDVVKHDEYAHNRGILWLAKT